MSGEDVARPKRASATVLDMVRSLGLMLVIVAATLIFVPGLLHPSNSQKVQPVAFADDVRGFRQVTGVPALTPEGLDSGWYANSKNLTYKGSNATLYIGWVSPSKKYAGLYESTKSDIRVSSSRAGDRSVRRRIGKLTILITGSASQAELTELADSLGS
ncbi:MAG TPA: DUF4245 domain-containing protein [Mycobacteriales bacterium]|nr:DUF4245 domain-containing protein [Mycobacteriales bacterium]